MTSVCSACGAPIVLGLPKHGRRPVALDLNPSPDGLWLIGPALGVDHHVVRRLSLLEAAVARQERVPLHPPHADTCRGDL